MTIIKEWCDGRKEEISFKEASRSLIDIYGSPTDIWELLSRGERLSTCAATYYQKPFWADKQIGDPRLKRKEAIRWK